MGFLLLRREIALGFGREIALEFGREFALGFGREIALRFVIWKDLSWREKFSSIWAFSFGEFLVLVQWKIHQEAGQDTVIK